MPLQKPQNTQASALSRRNISKTSTSTSTSTSIRKAPASKIARLSPAGKTTVNGTSNSEAPHTEPKLASQNLKPKVTVKNNTFNRTSSSANGRAEPQLAPKNSKPKATIQRSSRLASVKLLPPKVEKPSAVVVQTPKNGTFNSIKSFASKITRITPSRKSESDGSTSRVVSESLSHETRIPTPPAPQKAKAGYPNVSFVSGINALSFDTPKLRKPASHKASLDIPEALTLKQPAPKPLSTRDTSKLDNSNVGSESIDATKYEHTVDTIKIGNSNTAPDSIDAINHVHIEDISKSGNSNDTFKSIHAIIEDTSKRGESNAAFGSIDAINCASIEDTPKSGKSKATAKSVDANNILHTFSMSSETQQQPVPKIAQNEPAKESNVAKEQQHGALGAVDAKVSHVDSPISIKSTVSSPFILTPINIIPLSGEKVTSLPNHNLSDTTVKPLNGEKATGLPSNDQSCPKISVVEEKVTGLSIDGQSDAIRSSIEHDDRERRHIFSTGDWLNQKRRQYSSVQTPCPGDGTDDLISLNDTGRTFPSVRKFANKIARILPANRRERGGTLRYQTPVGGWKALSADPTTIGSSPSPYRMNLSPLTPGSCYLVRNSSQQELLNTINEYVVEAEKEREESRRRSDELADAAEEMLSLSEKEREENQRRSDELANAAEEMLALSEKERKEWVTKERALKARIEELEREAAALRKQVIAEKGEDHLGVQGANPHTGVWSDMEEMGAGAEEGGKRKGKGGKGRGRWRRKDQSWMLEHSESSTGTVIRMSPDIPASTQPSSAGTIIKNISIHHHHHWRVGRARHSS